MKSFISTCIFFVCIINAGCGDANQSSQQSAAPQAVNNPDTSTKKTGKAPEPPPTFDNIGDFDSLAPVAIVNAKAKDPYEKYGIEFSGNCYACDLAAISIGKKALFVANVCDDNDFYKEERFTYTASPTELVITTGKNKFIFTKIDPAPVYELKTEGPKFSLKNKRIAKYYTQKKVLAKFKQHDCGEFDG